MTAPVALGLALSAANIVSDDLTEVEKAAVARAASVSRRKTRWEDIVY